MNVILAGGGTAGHINPAISIAQALKTRYPDINILFVGNEGSLEERLVKKAGFDISFIKVQGIRRKLTLDNIKTAFRFVKSVSDCKKIITDFKADAVIGTGGYVSGPAVYAAHKLGIKTYIHEQNAFPGVTSKFLSNFVDTVFISFESSRKYFEKAKNVILSGNPLNEAFLFTDKKSAREQLGIPDTAFYVLSFAGSLGAYNVNKLFVDFIIKNNAEKDFLHTHATGGYGFEWMPDELKEKGFDISDTSTTSVCEYIYDMPLRLAACDLVICRAGAITLGEITAQGKPSILIPSPNVTNNHQYHNAMSLVEKGAALILEEKDATSDKLYDLALTIKNDKSLAKRLSDGAYSMAMLKACDVICDNVKNVK